MLSVIFRRNIWFFVRNRSFLCWRILFQLIMAHDSQYLGIDPTLLCTHGQTPPLHLEKNFPPLFSSFSFYYFFVAASTKGMFNILWIACLTTHYFDLVSFECFSCLCSFWGINPFKVILQSWPKKISLCCVISPLRQQAESRNLGQLFSQLSTEYWHRFGCYWIFATFQEWWSC